MIICPPSCCLALDYDYMCFNMDSDQLISYMVIVRFIILFFLTYYFSACVDIHPTSCWSILDVSPPLISLLW